MHLTCVLGVPNYNLPTDKPNLIECLRQVQVFYLEIGHYHFRTSISLLYILDRPRVSFDAK
jgi:hypothetical protein